MSEATVVEPQVRANGVSDAGIKDMQKLVLPQTDTVSNGNGHKTADSSNGIKAGPISNEQQITAQTQLADVRQQVTGHIVDQHPNEFPDSPAPLQPLPEKENSLITAGKLEDPQSPEPLVLGQALQTEPHPSITQTLKSLFGFQKKR